MAMKISANMSAVVHHIIDGPTTFPYAIDAHSAVSRFPDEWSETPWSLEDEAKAREAAGEPVVEVTPEEQDAIDAHAQAVAEANERLKAFRDKQAAEKAEADQAVVDERIVKSPAPRPAPKVKPLSPAQVRKRAAETDDERIVREKAEQDQWARAESAGAPITR